MNGKFLRQAEFTDQYFPKKLGLCHILGTTNATKLQLSRDNTLDKCSWKNI